jgi:signal transduction histidine kinase
MLGVSFGNIMLIESIVGEKFPDMAKEALVDVKKSLERMKAMVKQFLILARRNTEENSDRRIPVEFNLQEALIAIIKKLTDSKAENGSSLSIKENVPREIEIYFPHENFGEIFSLIINELFECSGGKALFFVSACETGDNTVLCLIEVKGLARASEAGDSVFEPFALPIANVGTGLALAVAKQLMEINDGKIEAGFPTPNDLNLTLTFPAHKKH